LPNNATVVEIGCGPCHSLGYLLDVAHPSWTIYSIDPYEGDGRFKGWIDTCHDFLGDKIDRVRFLRWRSPHVSKLFGDKTVDAVMIDGDHDYYPVKQDIAAWREKVRPGGYLAGDDVDPDFPGCEQAWDEAFPELVVYGSTAVVRL
jgi:hypothetical protein